MLPDFPNLKEKLNKLITSGMKSAISKYTIPFSEVPKTRLFEGHRSILVREDGTQEELEMHEIKAEIEIKLNEVETMTPDVIRKKIDVAAKEMASKQAKLFYAEIEKAAEKVGNVRDLKGRKYAIDDFFQGFEMVAIDFDENGNPCLPEILVVGKADEAFSPVLEQLKSDPQHKKRFSQIIDRKKEEWRAREANRKLVG